MTMPDTPPSRRGPSTGDPDDDPSGQLAAVVESSLERLDDVGDQVPGERLVWVAEQLGRVLDEGWCVAALDAGEFMTFRKRWSALGSPGSDREDHDGPGLVAMPQGSPALLAEPGIDRVLAGGSRVVDHRADTELARLLADLGLDHMALAGGSDDDGRQWLVALMGERPVLEPYAARLALTALVHVALRASRRGGAVS